MTTLTKVLFSPVTSLKRRFGRNSKALLDDCPPPTQIKNQCQFGECDEVIFIKPKDGILRPIL